MDARTLTDEQLTVAALSGDAEAFGQLYARYFQHAASKCAQWAGPDASPEDLAQDVFAEAWARILSGRAQLRGAFRPWLLGAVAPYVLAGRRHAWFAQTTAVASATDTAWRELREGPALAATDTDDLTATLAEQLARLTPRQRLCIQLCVLDGRRTRVAAEMTGLSRRTMTNLRIEALTRLRARMAPAGTAVAA
jgi:RNA polymerase sigma-70 factor (ECF subfamily)